MVWEQVELPAVADTSVIFPSIFKEAAADEDCIEHNGKHTHRRTSGVGQPAGGAAVRVVVVATLVGLVHNSRSWSSRRGRGGAWSGRRSA